MVHQSLCQAKDLRFKEVVPGRLLHVRIPGAGTSLDALSSYQYVWRSKETVSHNKEQRQAALQKLNQALCSLPQTNTLLTAGDLNMPLRTDRKHVGPGTVSLSLRTGEELLSRPEV